MELVPFGGPRKLLRGAEETMDEARVLEWTRRELNGGGCEISGGSITNIGGFAKENTYIMLGKK